MLRDVWGICRHLFGDASLVYTCSLKDVVNVALGWVLLTGVCVLNVITHDFLVFEQLAVLIFCVDM